MHPEPFKHFSFTMSVGGAGGTIKEEGSCSSWFDMLFCFFLLLLHGPAVMVVWRHPKVPCLRCTPQMYSPLIILQLWLGLVPYCCSLLYAYTTHSRLPLLVGPESICDLPTSLGSPVPQRVSFCCLVTVCLSALAWTHSQVLHHSMGCNRTFSNEIWILMLVGGGEEVASKFVLP